MKESSLPARKCRRGVENFPVILMQPAPLAKQLVAKKRVGKFPNLPIQSAS
jgi:hypothetical protein